MLHKIAPVRHPLTDLLKKRWSPRAFSGQPVSKEDMATILEAGTWSFSSSNHQPWRFIIGHRGSALFDQIHGCLLPGNQPWTKHAAVLLVSLAQTRLSKNHAENKWALHDVGAANMCIALQATSMGIYAHPMAGFDREKTMLEFGLDPEIVPVTFMALGYQGDAEQLEEPYRSWELAPRTRKDLSDVILKQD